MVNGKNSRNAVIRIPLRTPICVRPNGMHRLTLDAVLAGQIHERTHDGPAAVATVQSEFLEHWSMEGVVLPTASVAIFEGVRSRVSVPFTRSIFRVINDPAIRQNIAGVKWDNATGTLQRPFKAEMRPPEYEAIDVAAIWYFFRGDIDRVEQAFRRTTRIGALRSKGGGQIDTAGVSTDTVPNQSRCFGIVCGDRLMRPVPARCDRALAELGEIAYHSGMIENWQAPWHTDNTKEPCLVPVQIGPEMVLDIQTIAKLAL